MPLPARSSPQAHLLRFVRYEGNLAFFSVRPGGEARMVKPEEAEAIIEELADYHQLTVRRSVIRRWIILFVWFAADIAYLIYEATHPTTSLTAFLSLNAAFFAVSLANQESTDLLVWLRRKTIWHSLGHKLTVPSLSRAERIKRGYTWSVTTWALVGCGLLYFGLIKIYTRPGDELAGFDLHAINQWAIWSLFWIVLPGLLLLPFIAIAWKFFRRDR